MGGWPPSAGGARGGLTGAAIRASRCRTGPPRRSRLVRRTRPALDEARTPRSRPFRRGTRRDAGVVINDGVHEAGADLGLVVLVAGTGPLPGCLPVPVALRSDEVAPAAAVGNVSELLHIDVD